MPTSDAFAADAPTVRASARLAAGSNLAPRAVGHALLLGIGADLLLRDGIDGAGFPVWIALLALALTSLTWRAKREVTRPATAWLSVAILAACGLAWRDSEMLKVLDVLATAGALGMASIALGNEHAGLLAERFRNTLWAGASMARTMVPGIIPNLAEALFDARRDESWESRSRRSVRTVLLGLAVLVVFGSLLRSADPVFASLVAVPDLDVGLLASHVFLIAWFAWLVSGWANAALGCRMMGARAPNHFPFSIGQQDLAATLGVLNVLFVAFIAAQLGWLFGGEAFLQARTGLTAAEYARHGFFEVVWVAALVIPMLLITRGALVSDRVVARRHTALAVPLLLLLAGIIVSAAARMRLYVHYYGLTVDRLYTLIFMAWLVGVLAWLGATVLRDRGRSFVAGVIGSGLCVLVGLNVAAPDAIVARFNAARPTASPNEPGTDVRHLSELSGEAVDVAIAQTLASRRSRPGSLARTQEDAARCEGASNLLRRWGPSSPSAIRRGESDAWRTWNAGEQHALRVVGARAGELRSVVHASCTKASRLNAVRA